MPKKQRYPAILEEMIAAGETPDMVISDIGTAPGIADLGFNYDMTPLMKKYNITYTHALNLYQGKDFNTVIRETEEEIDKKVAEMKAMR